MREFEISGAAGTDDMESIIENACKTAALRQIAKTTLSIYPDCTHWHYKQGERRGVLEVTWWPREGRAWLSVHDNRSADWIDEVLPELKADIEARLAEGVAL